MTFLMCKVSNDIPKSSRDLRKLIFHHIIPVKKRHFIHIMTFRTRKVLLSVVLSALKQMQQS